MLAAQLVAPRRFECVDAALPIPDAAQIRVRIAGCGVCGSSVPVWQGRPWFDYPQPPGAPGHEGWGTVDAVGADVTDFAEGDRVALLGQHSFAEYDVVTAASAVRLPPEVPGDFPGEPLACARNVLRRTELEDGQLIVIIGIGFLGATLVHLAAERGARVIAVSRRAFARDLARRLGAIAALSTDEPEAVLTAVQQHNDGLLAPRVIEAAGVQATLDLATRLCGVRSRLIIAGFHQDGPRSVDVQQWNWHGIDVINAHERDPAEYIRGMRAAVDLAASGRLEVGPLLTHHLPLRDIDAAFALLEERPEGFLKAVVHPGNGAK